MILVIYYDLSPSTRTKNILVVYIIVIVYLNTNIFLFLDNEEIYNYGHMTYDMIWCHRLRLWEKGLEE